MVHLIIYAHPSEDSFSNQLVQRLKEYSGSLNEVIVRDLYAMNFDPVLSQEELINLKKGKVAEDVLKEQELVEKADVISLVYPLWWASFPAILKGYIDRVFSYGFAYKAGEDGVEGLLTGRGVVLHTSMGNSIADYEEGELLATFTLSQGHEIFGFCDIEVMHHFFYPEIITSSAETKKEYISSTLEYYKELFISDRN